MKITSQTSATQVVVSFTCTDDNGDYEYMDSLVLPKDEYDSYTADEIQAKIAAKYDAWYTYMTTSKD